MGITLKTMIVLLANNDPIEVYNQLLETDKDFREFIESNKDKSTAEMIKCYNLTQIIREESHT